ncbi:MAG TPA: 5'-deoxyadenosine deaminase [Blastocatellia bacterium]|nr:5'-deoxyadenosine deaminase [Blastocatellia bacterium]
MSKSLLIKGATVVTLDPKNNIFNGDVLIEDGRIAALGSNLGERSREVVEAAGRVLLPGFVQTHVHLCQTLFRGSADDLSLLDWLQKRIWPIEAAHTAESVLASARLGVAELIRGGTTCALTMETVHHTEAVFQAVDEMGFRATIGKCMMDKGEGVPDGLREETEDSIEQSLGLLERWHGRAGGRIRYCFAPRFAISCTRELLERVGRLAREHRVLVHTHASESQGEIQAVERETGQRNIEYLNQVGLAASNVVLAHCVWLNDAEFDILSRTRTHVSHCPSSNLKLGSGIAPVPEMLDRRISVSLGADGAACNNRLDMFTEMRTAALIQKAMKGPEALPALTVLRMATVGGAAALGLEDQVGSIEVGKRGDLILLDLERLHTTPHPDLISTIVYAATANEVSTVILDGKVVVLGGLLLTADEQTLMLEADENAEILRSTTSMTD